MTDYIKSSSGILIPPVLAGAADSPYRSTSALNRAIREWFPSSGDADETLLPSLSTLRAQSRDLDRNEAIARGATENIVGNVVAEGLRPQARLDHEFLGISEAEARAFERTAEKIYELHSQSIHSDFRLVAPFQVNQAVAMRSVLLDGDCLAVRRFRSGLGGILGTCVQIIEGARLENPFDGPATADIREGVELDTNGIPVAYHIRSSSPARSLSLENRITRIRFENPSSVIIFKTGLRTTHSLARRAGMDRRCREGRAEAQGAGEKDRTGLKHGLSPCRGLKNVPPFPTPASRNLCILETFFTDLPHVHKLPHDQAN